eukprot:CAMPEP_0196735658 /NCGR_PEP_ID=MMETSP1091-20130531/14012_1 /TAXON_ID=302021 /ORGANISM="Rhodomonas sp., Strain CCMP768" /LENGTH=245 /DNA_ID=CAMNT_0042079313 /DNA_START=227 /DNA_END=966 /DNA_ORIENTATION=-
MGANLEKLRKLKQSAHMSSRRNRLLIAVSEGKAHMQLEMRIPVLATKPLAKSVGFVLIIAASMIARNAGVPASVSTSASAGTVRSAAGPASAITCASDASAKSAMGQGSASNAEAAGLQGVPGERNLRSREPEALLPGEWRGWGVRARQDSELLQAVPRPRPVQRQAAAQAAPRIGSQHGGDNNNADNASDILQTIYLLEPAVGVPDPDLSLLVRPNVGVANPLLVHDDDWLAGSGNRTWVSEWQ